MKTKDKMISGFSKLSKPEKIAWLAKHFLTSNPMEAAREFASFWHSNLEAQKLFDGISENTLTNFYMPYGVAPNFVIDDRVYCVPMVIEESSVVAAASSSAKFWESRGGFRTQILGTTKVGQVHFIWQGNDTLKLFSYFNAIKPLLLDSVKHLTSNMEQRGGGIKDVQLRYMPEVEQDYYQLYVTFETCDAMGANFINSILETFAQVFTNEALHYHEFSDLEQHIPIIMSILSNYTPECLVRAWVSCDIDKLGEFDEMSSSEFAHKFVTAVKIAQNDVFRATTHNKGIYNGIDAVVIATGNDFRAIEACGHAYAARSGQYRSLSQASIAGNQFIFSLELPLALGTIGGLTKIHPLARLSLDLLGNPSATELMSITAAVGLAQNFAAVRSLITTGIQKGHMKMHLHNILTHFEATPYEREAAVVHFEQTTISFSSVRSFLQQLRSQFNNASELIPIG